MLGLSQQHKDIKMITLKEFMEAVNYRITEGSTYGWNCFGPNAYTLDSWNGDQDGHSASIVFDTRTQQVYQVTAYDYGQSRAYRLIDPAYAKTYSEEGLYRESNINEAWDNVEYTDLELESDFLEKLTAIVNEEDYDTRVSVPVDFSDEELLKYMKLAHEQDITFNQLIETALREAISRHGVTV
jgi:hypothetical protein